MAIGNVPTGGNFAPRIDKVLEKAYIDTKTLNTSVYRMVPDRPYIDMTVAVHSVYIPPAEGSKNGKPQWRSQVCRNFDPKTGKFEERGCLFCKLEVMAARDYYTNLIDRAAEESKPAKFIQPSDWELETGFIDVENRSRTWTPMRVMRFTLAAARDVQKIEQGNVVKGVAYPVGDADYGIDLIFTYDEKAAAAKRMVINSSPDGRSQLDDEQLNYCYYKLDPEVYFPAPEAKENYRFLKANPILFLDREGEKELDPDQVLDVIEEYESEHGRDAGGSRGSTSSRSVGTSGGSARRREDADKDDDVPPPPRRPRNSESEEPVAPRRSARNAQAEDEDAAQARPARSRSRGGDDEAPARTSRAGRNAPAKTTRTESKPNPEYATWLAVASLADAVADTFAPVIDKLNDDDYEFVLPAIGDDHAAASLNVLADMVADGDLSSDVVFDMTQDDAAADAFDKVVATLADLRKAGVKDFDAILNAEEPAKTIEVEVEVEAEDGDNGAQEDSPVTRARASSRRRSAPAEDQDEVAATPRRRSAAAAPVDEEEEEQDAATTSRRNRSRATQPDADEDEAPRTTGRASRRPVQAAEDDADEDDGNPAAGRAARRPARGRGAGSFESYDD